MGSGSSKKSTPTILRGYRSEPENKEIPFQENKRAKDAKDTVEMEETSDEDTVLVNIKKDDTKQDNSEQKMSLIGSEEDSKDFVKTVDGTGSGGWPVRCFAKLDFNINGYHGGCAGLLLISTSYGGKGEETNVEAMLLRSGFDCNHRQHKSVFRAHEGHFSAENYLVEDEQGTLIGDCNFGTNHLRLLTNDSCYGNLRNGMFTKGNDDGNPTVLPLNVNGNWNAEAGNGSGLTMVLCSGAEGSEAPAAVYMIKSGFKDNKFMSKLFAGEDKFQFSLEGENLAVTGPKGSRYGLFHNRNNLSEAAEESHVFVAQTQTIDGKVSTVLLEKVQGHAAMIILCSNSNGMEDSTVASMYFITLTDGKLTTAKELAGAHGKSYKNSDLWTFEIKKGRLEVIGPDGPCKYGLMSNIHTTKRELLLSVKQGSCIATGEDTKMIGKVKVTKAGVTGEVNKFLDIHIMWNHKVITEIPGTKLKKEDGIYKFKYDWSENETVIGHHMVRVFASRKHLKTGEDVYIELTGSPHQLIFQKPGVVYALNCGSQAYQAVNDIVYSSEFSQYASYDPEFCRGNQFKSLGACKTNADLPNAMLKTLDGFLYTTSRNGHGHGDEGQMVRYELTDIPNGSYIFRIHSNNPFENLVCNGKDVSAITREHVAKQKSALDIPQFVGFTVDIDVEVRDGIFQFHTRALDTTFRHSEKVGAFALLDKKKYKEKSISVAQKKEEIQEKQKLADTVAPLNNSVTRKALTIVGWSPNLLQNASAGLGDMKHWNTRGDFKIGTGGYNTERCIETSHSWCEKYQEVNLTDHFSAEYLDTAPDIQVVEWYTQGGCGGGFYSMTVKLLTESGETVSEFSTGQIGSVYNAKWLEASHVFTNYGPGVRLVGFSSKGKDDKFWAGHFGIKMSGAEVRVKRETKPAADDEYCDLDIKDTDTVKKSLLDKLVMQVLSDNQELLKDFVEEESIPVDKAFEKQTEIVHDSAAPKVSKKRIQRKKREIRVFVSSTFRDFSNEREEIIKKAFREINRLCSDRGVFFTYVDLRWGITSEQTDDGKTIAICLQEIDRCRPYFICLMGDRFGWSQKSDKKDEVLDMTYNYAIENHPGLTWIEKYRYDTSVTTLEVFHGALNNPSETNNKCLFYMRDPVKKEDYAEDQYKRMISESDWHHERQEWLKSEVLKHKEIKVTRFKTASEVAELIKKDLKRCVDEDFPVGTELTKLEQQREAHNAFAEKRCRVYIGREDYFRTVDEKRSKKINQPFVLLGESGSGKSAFVANWAKRVEDGEPDTFMFVHFIGSSADSASYIKLLRRLLEEMKTHYGFDMVIPSSDSHLINEVSKWLRMAGSRSKVVLVFDALNQLDDGSGQDGPEHDLLWVPAELPPSVFLLLSTLPGRAMNACKDHGWPSMKVEPLDDSQKALIITDYLEGIYGKTLNQDQKDMIVSAKQTSNALYLKSLLDEVRMYGSFRTLTDKIREYLTANSPDDLFAKILERLEQDFEQGSNSSVIDVLNFTCNEYPITLSRPDLVRDATTALWCSNRGMSEAELTEFLDVKSAVWSPFYLSLYENLVNRDGILNFFHDHLRQAVEKKYLSTKEEKKKFYLKLADFFEMRELSARKVEELPFLLMRAGELDRLKATVSDLDVFFKMSDNEDGIFELVKAWKTIGDFSLSEEAYMQKLAAVTKQEIQQNSDHYCKLYSQLGNFFQTLGLMEAAKNIYLTLIKQLEMNYGISHGCIVYSAHNHSWVYRCQCYTVIKSLQELGAVYYKMGEYEKAVDIYTDAINRQTRLESPTQKLQLCEGLLGMASVYIEQEKMAKAKYLMTRALELSTDILGRKHHFVAAIFTKLGQLSYKQGRIDEALAFFMQDLKVTRSEVGTNHPRMATVLNEIALVYDDRNDVIAGKLYEAALAIVLETYGRHYLGTAIIRYNLGAFYFGTNYFAKARYQFEEAYKVLQSFLGDDHPDTLAAKQAKDSVST
ncbi:uncharacterized protein LOC123525710 isoform X2 [Mercenaria mercenaria]|uniref:uncharacterized protein LOC123525710 isoform X2 n=1 Tax=Mercenaria mercenaria TaxID=6596 RepID=UPI00234EA13E|nr:uncharacterized protein LOC123525710 isoform X2 [Mercenaria mercenaria]